MGILSAIGGFFGGLGRIPGSIASWSLPSRIALAVGGFQVVAVLLAVAVMFLPGQDTNVFQAWWRPGKLLALGLLLLLTPVIVYQAAKFWLERDAPRWPDLLDAWQAGLTELSRQGIDLADFPLFLVLGTPDDGLERRLLENASGLGAVTAAPSPAAALHFYAGAEGVFLCLTAACQTSEAVRRHRGQPGSSGVAVQSRQPVASNDVHGTISIDQVMQAAAAPETAASPPPVDRDLINATIQIDSIAPDSSATLPLCFPRPTATLTSDDRDTLAQRLAYVCELIKRHRGGLAPVNGLLVALPAGMTGGSYDTAGIGRGIGDDFISLGKALGLQAPVTFLVHGLEEDRGFLELLRRMPAAERGSRLGQRVAVGLSPSYEQFGVVAAKACGMVEDLILGRLLRSPGILEEQNNADLVGLACRLRYDLSGRLTAILRRAFSGSDDEDALPLLAGCYLGGCGKQPDQRGFVSGVFEKIFDLQGELAWTDETLRIDAAAARLATVLWWIAGLGGASVVGFFAWKILGS
jgi:hypothetical protein